VSLIRRYEPDRPGHTDKAQRGRLYSATLLSLRTWRGSTWGTGHGDHFIALDDAAVRQVLLGALLAYLSILAGAKSGHVGRPKLTPHKRHTCGHSLTDVCKANRIHDERIAMTPLQRGAAWAGIIAIPLTALGIYVAHSDARVPLKQGGSAGGSAVVEPTDVRSSQPSKSVAPERIKISYPPRSPSPYPVSRIVTVQGDGDIPSGHHLWIFVYGTGSAMYYPQDNPVDAVVPPPWHVPGVIVGSVSNKEIGHDFMIYALVVDDSVHARIQANNSGFDGKTWRTELERYVLDKVLVRRK
jgi:hypothetical protein